jgi:hypothetical protein
MDALKKIPLPWIVIGVLVVIVLVLLFQQRRSGFTPTAGAPITMMDLQEFSVFSPSQKQNYVDKLMAYQPKLSNAVSSNSITTYKMLLDEVMTQAVIGDPMIPPPNPMVPPPNPMVPMPPTKCPRGQFSPTGKQPGCMPCPLNTYCSMEGMTAPTRCPTGTRSPMGSSSASMCRR